ncbi:FAD-binding oxidoreductase [Glutamicibacter sp. MNS18]|uniref:NAD(P)/FAD-dependent oxidoreductase n=1 Tax=Glutamicibacter sp. MNS18 TaxID=2989817 RepID=UPI002235D62C|nr:FAD-binding oxidoreductase [Glutamicibacter sp. MNS18]MCW4466275.1 FAD-binding oxidoreductase [Glutamicibacter sp. MNS18]
MAGAVIDLKPRFDSRLPDSADVVIIGGGIMGVSAAWHLAKSGVQNIVLLELGDLGGGSSAKPLGGVRANFSDPGNIMLGKRSLEAYRKFDAEFGAGIGLQQVGYLFLCRNDDSLQALEAATATQNSMGVSSRMIDAEEAERINPFIDARALNGASFSPEDGYAEPALAVAGYAHAARQLGVRILTHTQVLDIETAEGTIRSVRTNRGKISTNAVICCAGAWSAQIGQMAGVSLPVVPTKRMIGLTMPQATTPARIPFTLDLATTMYFHNYGSGLLLGISHEQPEGFGREFDYSWLAEFNDAAAVCAPGLENPDLVGGWAGYYENTPDHNALIGHSRDLPGFFYATGFSGHGFLQGPAVGELVADLYHGRTSFMDPTPFSVDRFDNDTSRLREVNII